MEMTLKLGAIYRRTQQGEIVPTLNNVSISLYWPWQQWFLSRFYKKATRVNKQNLTLGLMPWVRRYLWPRFHGIM